MKKKVYISPDINVTLFVVESHLMDNSVETVGGINGMTVSQQDFQGGSVDVKSHGSYNVWNDDWSKN